MDEAVRARTVAREAVDDITPRPLHELIDTRLEHAPVAPGIVTLVAAQAATQSEPPTDLDQRTAGVQLIYDGLRLIRTLARSNAWAEPQETPDADLEILGADVLVGRGFYLLARTQAAHKAVDTVQQFGRDETNRTTGHPTSDPALESDIFELAIIAGSTATGHEHPVGTRDFAVDLAATLGTPTATNLRANGTIEALTDLVTNQPRQTTAPDRSRAESSIIDR